MILPSNPPRLLAEPWRIPAPAHGAVALLILGVTCASLHFFYTRGLSNLYGDGLAHMEGARRIFDSITPGYQEIGSVWLPLYHLICAPLAINDFLWRTGLAGGLVSSAAFALTAYLLFRLGAEINRNLAAGLVALAVVLMCPSFLYLASTPLTEPLALLWSVLVAYLLFRYSQSGSWKSLAGAAVAAFLGTLTRYEGWNVLPFATLLVFLIRPLPVEAALHSRLVFCRCRGQWPPSVAYPQCLSLSQPFGILQWHGLGEGHLRPPVGHHRLPLSYGWELAPFRALLLRGSKAGDRRLGARAGRPGFGGLVRKFARIPARRRCCALHRSATVLHSGHGICSGPAVCAHAFPSRALQPTVWH